MTTLLYSAYAKLPLSVRNPISHLVRHNPILGKTARALLNTLNTDGFITMTPDTPPALTRALQTVKSEGLPGDYFEFGLYRGYTFLHAQKEAQRLGLNNMRFYGFDSFAGLPAIDEVDGSAGIWQQGDYACDRTQVEAYLRKYGAHAGSYTLVEGYFDQSLTPELRQRLQPQKVAIALIDCDLYASTVPVLNWLSDLLQPNSILLFDDWNCAEQDDDKGERRAFGEFLAAHPEWSAEPWFSFGWHGQAFRLRAVR
jgi:O-methyltransferase